MHQQAFLRSSRDNAPNEVYVSGVCLTGLSPEMRGRELPTLTGCCGQMLEDGRANGNKVWSGQVGSMLRLTFDRASAVKLAQYCSIPI